ncbi:hypothetical protein MAR_021084 [Mya arenaria]|uniref:Ig-like domain-containing protein n=1 Tax=Mya arenaria TaxID=6604 RepID=A0ABY7E773_MYAAR|nr:hypothetical protein MAR_021084 [Mya arenaria]
MGEYKCTATHSVYTTYNDTKTYSVTVILNQYQQERNQALTFIRGCSLRICDGDCKFACAPFPDLKPKAHGPDSISIFPLTSSYTRTEGDIQEDITCSTVCHPECAYTWSKVGTSGVVRNNSILNLDQLTRQEAGSYICSATNPISSATRNGSTVVVEVILPSHPEQ